MNRPIDIVKCSVCGGHHRDLLTYPLLPTTTINKLTYVRYGVCPDTKATIYLAYDNYTLVNIPAPSINFPKEVKVSTESHYIWLPTEVFELLLNCLNNQKFLPTPDNQSEFEKDMQSYIDEFNISMREWLNR